MTHIQDFLRSIGTLDELMTTYNIKVKRHEQHPNLVLLKYDMVNSNMDSLLVQECRGIILDESNDWAIVSRSFDKFFNHGEGHAAEIEWASARVQEKLDGSLCSLYFYGGTWHVATTGTPDASGHVDGDEKTFAQLFWEVFNEHGCEMPPSEHAGTTFMFELITPLNRIVCRYPTRMLILLAARDTHTGEFTPPLHEAAGMLNVAPVREFPLGDVGSVLATFSTMNPLEQEGYVVVDRHGHRIKVKHPGYVALHHAKDGMSPRALMDIARKGEVSEVAAAFPEMQEELNTWKQRIDAWTAMVDAQLAAIPATPIQKEFAAHATKTKFPAPLFAIRAGKAANAKAFMAGITTDAAMAYLEDT
jgi:hypothetical protein